jgi:hypothetical protein
MAQPEGRPTRPQTHPLSRTQSPARIDSARPGSHARASGWGRPLRPAALHDAGGLILMPGPPGWGRPLRYALNVWRAYATPTGISLRAVDNWSL